MKGCLGERQGARCAAAPTLTRPARARSIAGQALWTRMYNSFGYLTQGNGYGGHIFPVVFGETGSFLTAVRPPWQPCAPGAPRLGYA